MIRFDTVFGLAFDVEKDSGRASGFRPADVDLGAHLKLFGDLRLDGFAALLRLGFAKRIVLIGGNEGRYKDDGSIVNRAKAIGRMLIYDCDVSKEKVVPLPSASNTGGNIEVIRQVISGDIKQTHAVVTNHYHLPRTLAMLYQAGLGIPGFSAESFITMLYPSRKDEIIQTLSGPDYAKRNAEEIQGIGQIVDKTYQARTDTPP